MQHRRLITAMTLVAFLPLAAGCSNTRTVPIGSDPSAAEAVAEFQAGESLEISGFARASDGYRDWDGQVRMVAPDSLEFIPEPHSTKPASDARFRLPCEEVTSLSVVVPDWAATRVATVVTVLVVGAAITTAILVSSENTDPWF
jgi:hypothetical protein